MIQASPTLSLPSLSASLVRRRRPLMLAPPVVAIPLPTEDLSQGKGRWPGWREDLRFFASCYAAGLAFFLIMLS
jgi:hypothetical protein